MQNKPTRGELILAHTLAIRLKREKDKAYGKSHNQWRKDLGEFNKKPKLSGDDNREKL